MVMANGTGFMMFSSEKTKFRNKLFKDYRIVLYLERYLFAPPLFSSSIGYGYTAFIDSIPFLNS
jgi:hypothetical protein